MEKVNLHELSEQLSEMTNLKCLATENSVLVYPNQFGCIFTIHFEDIIKLCEVYNLVFYVDFESKYLRITNL